MSNRNCFLFYIVLFLSYFPVLAKSQQFTIGNISYSIINNTEQTVRVGWQQQTSSGWQYSMCIDTNTEGEIIIPQTVVYNGATYTVTEIAMGAFKDCKKITSVNLPETVEVIGTDAFSSCTSLINIVIPNNVDSIGSRAFYGCKSLTYINLPYSLSSLESSTFSDTGLTKIHIPESIKKIGSYAFSRCKIKKLEIPKNVSIIGDGAFQYCNELETVVLGANIQSIKSGAFSDCSKLTRVYSNSKTPISGSRYAFNRINTDIVTLYVPIGAKSLYVNSSTYSPWSVFSNIEESNSPVFAEINSGEDLIEAEFMLVDSINNKVQLGLESCTAIPSEIVGSFTIPSVITDYYGNKYQVAGIGYKAFYGCHYLSEIVIPQCVTYIFKAFEGCEHIVSVVVNNRNPMSIIDSPDDAFEGIGEDAILYVPAGTKERYEQSGIWNIFSHIIELSPISTGDITAQYGSSAILPISLRNTEPIAGVQFKLTLPEGISVSDNDGYLIAFTTERTNGMTIMGRKDPDEGNSYLFAMLSLFGNAIAGNEGPIMNIQLNINQDVEQGVYDIKLEDVYLATNTYETLNPAESTSELTITDVLIGDVNGNGQIDIGDAVCIVNHLVNKLNSVFIEVAADLNGNNQIDIGDAVMIVNYLVGKTDSLAPQLILEEETTNERDPD